MASIVSRNPPPSGSTSQAKDFFWMSIRLGTSIDLSRRANVRRVRGASTAATTATPRGVRRARGGAQLLPKGIQARPAKIAQGTTDPRRGALDSHGPRPTRLPYVAGRALWTAATIGRVASY